MGILGKRTRRIKGIDNIAKNIVYSGSKQNVKMTMIHGKILYEDGKYNIGEAPEDIYKEANKILKRIG